MWAAVVIWFVLLKGWVEAHCPSDLTPSNFTTPDGILVAPCCYKGSNGEPCCDSTGNPCHNIEPSPDCCEGNAGSCFALFNRDGVDPAGFKVSSQGYTEDKRCIWDGTSTSGHGKCFAPTLEKWQGPLNQAAAVDNGIPPLRDLPARPLCLTNSIAVDQKTIYLTCSSQPDGAPCFFNQQLGSCDKGACYFATKTSSGPQSPPTPLISSPPPSPFISSPPPAPASPTPPAPILSSPPAPTTPLPTPILSPPQVPTISPPIPPPVPTTSPPAPILSPPPAPTTSPPIPPRVPTTSPPAPILSPPPVPTTSPPIPPPVPTTPPPTPNPPPPPVPSVTLDNIVLHEYDIPNVPYRGYVTGTVVDSSSTIPLGPFSIDFFSENGQNEYQVTLPDGSTSAPLLGRRRQLLQTASGSLLITNCPSPPDSVTIDVCGSTTCASSDAFLRPAGDYSFTFVPGPLQSPTGLCQGPLLDVINAFALARTCAAIEAQAIGAGAAIGTAVPLVGTAAGGVAGSLAAAAICVILFENQIKALECSLLNEDNNLAFFLVDPLKGSIFLGRGVPNTLPTTFPPLDGSRTSFCTDCSVIQPGVIGLCDGYSTLSCASSCVDADCRACTACDVRFIRSYKDTTSPSGCAQCQVDFCSIFPGELFPYDVYAYRSDEEASCSRSLNDAVSQVQASGGFAFNPGYVCFNGPDIVLGR